MDNQPYPHDRSHQSYQHRETSNQPYSAEQEYQQGEIASHSYTSNPPEQEYQHPTTPLSSGYQQPRYQGNQVPYGGQTPGPSNDVVRTSDMGNMHAQSRYATYRDAMGNLVESHQQVFEDQNQTRANIRYWTSTILYFLLGVVEILLLLRFIFRLLGANQDNGFITFLYSLSYPFVVAFHGIFDARALGKGGVFEFSTLIAMLIYALLIWGLVSFVRVIFAPTQASRQSVTTSRRSQY